MPEPTTFRLLVVPGVTPDKWGRVWSQRRPEVALHLVPAEAATQEALLVDGVADAGIVRLPVDREVFDAIPLYTEATVVVVPRDHVVTAADEVSAADLAGEPLLVPHDDVVGWSGTPDTVVTDRPASTAAAVELVAAGDGVLVVPQSLARLHHRRDLTYRVLTDAPTSSVGLGWVRDRHDDLVEEMIGVVRGRTANSTRGRTPSASSAPDPATQAGRQPGRGAAGRGTASGERQTGRGTAGRGSSPSGRTGGRQGGSASHGSRRRRGR